MDAYTLAETPWVLTEAALTVAKDDLVPNDVTALLGLTPTTVRLPGPDRWAPAADPAGRWTLRVDESATREFDTQVQTLFDLVEPRAEALQALRAQGCEVRVSLRGFTGDRATLTLPPRLLERLAHLGLPVEVTPNTNAR